MKKKEEQEMKPRSSRIWIPATAINQVLASAAAVGILALVVGIGFASYLIPTKKEKKED